MKGLKKLGRLCLKVAVILTVTLLLFEMIYRFNWIDFYSAELTALNTEKELNTKKKKLLVFGDSFSANNEGYVSMLQDSLTEFTTINSSVVGISTKQIRLFFEDRVEEFAPDAILIQLYVGNDFQDYHHTRNWSKLSFIRNTYSLVGDQLMSLQYLNYKLGGLGKSNAKAKGRAQGEFNTATYNRREVRYFNADPNSLKNAILLEGDQKTTYEEMRDDLKEMLEGCQIPVYVLVLPHAAQVTNEYRKNMISLGATLPLKTCIGEFSFYNQLRKDLSEQKNVEVISPLFRFRLDAHRKDLFYPNDPHLALYGQQRLFDFVAKKISLKN